MNGVLPAVSLRLTVNGNVREFDNVATVSDLLGALGMVSGRVAVMVNDAVIRRAQHPEHALANDDNVEVITMVGGG